MNKKGINSHKTTVHCGKLFIFFAKIVFESKNKMYFCVIRINAHLEGLFSKHTTFSRSTLLINQLLVYLKLPLQKLKISFR